jgi:hypothetical protein
MQRQLDFAPPQFSAPSQSLDWHCAARLTGGAFVATSGSFGVCVSTSIIRSNSSRFGISHVIQPTPALSIGGLHLVKQGAGFIVLSPVNHLRAFKEFFN